MTYWQATMTWGERLDRVDSRIGPSGLPRRPSGILNCDHTAGEFGNCKAQQLVHSRRMEEKNRHRAPAWSGLVWLCQRLVRETFCFFASWRFSATCSRRLLLTHMLCLVALILAAGPLAAEAKVWRAGNYSFSDEMGGFTIRSITGKGSREDPIVIEEELNSASPVTMVVRTEGGALDPEGNLATSALYLRIVTLNASGQAWIEFEFELQEILHRASIFSDGLSFDQRRENSDRITSSAFDQFRRDFEPYDKLRFIEGKVDPRETAEFNFALTDFTPRWQFYIVQDPRIPSS